MRLEYWDDHPLATPIFPERFKYNQEVRLLIVTYLDGAVIAYLDVPKTSAFLNETNTQWVKDFLDARDRFKHVQLVYPD